MIGGILKNAQKISASILMRFYDQWKWKWKIDHIDTTLIDLGLNMDSSILNIKGVSIYIK